MIPKTIPFKLKCSDDHFTNDELDCLQKYGHLLQSLIKLYMPGNQEEEAFCEKVNQINKTNPNSFDKALFRKPVTGKFNVFLKYATILVIEGKPLEIGNQKASHNKRRIIESRAGGGFSTDDQENRYANPKPRTDDWPSSGGPEPD